MWKPHLLKGACSLLENPDEYDWFVPVCVCVCVCMYVCVCVWAYVLSYIYTHDNIWT